MPSLTALTAMLLATGAPGAPTPKSPKVKKPPACLKFRKKAPQQLSFFPGLKPPPMTLERLLRIPERERPLFVVSDGMGVDSSGVLEGLRRFGLRPDIVLHADTGDEKPATVAFREIRNRWLRSLGFPELTIVRRKPSVSGVTGKAFATLGEKCIANETLPSLAFGGPGKKACSVEWKIKPQESWMEKDPRAQALWGEGGRVVKAIGYDAGKIDSKRAWQLVNDECYEYVYPLREWNWDRPRTIAELRATGAPVPPKSSCVFCPASKPWEIAIIVRDYPDIADQIIEMERVAAPRLTKIEGLWGAGVKGFRKGKGGVLVPTGAVRKPGSMGKFIQELRADLETMQRYLAMEPNEDTYEGPVGGLPQFVGVGGTEAPLSTRRHLPLVEVEDDDLEAAEDDEEDRGEGEGEDDDLEAAE